MARLAARLSVLRETRDRQALTAARVSRNDIPAKLPVLITGASGIGKSECEAQSSAEANADNIIMHPVVKDPTGSVLARHLGCRCVHA